MHSVPSAAATLGYYLNPSDISKVPKGQMLNTDFLTNATPHRGILNMTQLNTRQIDAAIKSCQKLTTLKQVKSGNTKTTANEAGCGWVTRGDGSEGQGVFGNYTQTFGPIPSDALHYYPPGIVNSKSADELKIHCGMTECVRESTREGFTSIDESTEIPTCAKYDRCQDMKYFDSIMEPGLCGYCPPSGRFVPMSNGAPKYANAPCNSSLITDYTKCPMSSKHGNLKEAFTTLAPLDSCSAPLTRDCLVLAAKTAGCSPEGTLIASLYTSPPTSGYDDALQSQASYRIYQAQTNPLTVTTDKAATIQAALAQFKSMYTATNSTNSTTSAAARDLCLQKDLDAYSFCNDVTDTTIVNAGNIVCLQQKYLNKGGKVIDPMYPTLEKCVGKKFSQC